jgi:hypothetical protein
MGNIARPSLKKKERKEKFAPTSLCPRGNFKAAQHSIPEVTWVSLAAFCQIYDEN